MYLIRDKHSLAVVYIDYSNCLCPPPESQVLGQYCTDNFEIGWTENSFIPANFRISETGEIIEFSLSELIATGDYKLPPTLKIVGGQLVRKSTEEKLEEELITLEQLKVRSTGYFSELSFHKRQALIPNYKLENATLGIYDEQTTACYRATVQVFRDEFYRLKKAIERAQTVKELEAIKDNFPDKIIESHKDK